jgi:hypothetical protein
VEAPSRLENNYYLGNGFVKPQPKAIILETHISDKLFHEEVIGTISTRLGPLVRCHAAKEVVFLRLF